MKFTLKNASEFGWNGLKGRSYNTEADFGNASAAYFEIDGSHGKVKTMKSDRVYLVLEGSGTFTIGDEIIDVEKSDVVIVPKDTPYDYSSKEGVIMKLFLVHTPAYSPEFEVKL